MGGNSLERKGLLECYRDHTHTHTHTHSFLLYAVHSHLQRQGYFRRALLNLCSLPMCSVYTYGVEGWRTEPNVSTRTPSLCGAAEKTSCLTERESEQEKAIYFTVFRDAYNVVVSQEQMMPKKEYCMSAFSDQGLFLFFFCYFLSHFHSSRKPSALSSISCSL